MATVPFRVSGDVRRFASSTSNQNRAENRAQVIAGLCRNGPQCTCPYNHDFSSIAPNAHNGNNSKKSLSVESPAFTPRSGNAQPVRVVGISPKAAATASFTPRVTTPAGLSHSKDPSGDFAQQQVFQQTQQFQEFVPGQNFVASQSVNIDSQPQISTPLNAFGDAFITTQALAGLDSSSAQINPYVQSAAGVSAQSFFQDNASFKHPLNYHLYAHWGPRPDNLSPYQRSTVDFFMPDDFREDLQRKAEATRQTFPNSTLPQKVEYLHSLVAIDTTNQKSPGILGYPSWMYKATSSRDARIYALRRVEGYRLTSEAAIRTINAWKRIDNASIVRIHDCFTGRWFGDSSLILVTDYHPRAQTLMEKYFAPGRHALRAGSPIIPELVLWGLLAQLTNVIRTIHESGLAAQTVTLSKILLTSKNRIRLNGCGVLDITTHETSRLLSELQKADLQDLGRVLLALAARNPSAHQSMAKALELVGRSYSERFRACLAWLLAPPDTTSPELDTATETATTTPNEYNINTFFLSIADKVLGSFDSVLHLEDSLTAQYLPELENGRLFRLVSKIGMIYGRPDPSTTGPDVPPAQRNQQGTAWSETGERYFLKLFYEYCFSPVDHEGRPIMNLAHTITCLNKLDAGIDETIQLVSRDESTILITSYKEVKRGWEACWAELSKAAGNNINNMNRR